MPTSPLLSRALVAAIALQLSVAGLVVVAGGPGAEAAAALERAEVLPTVGLVERDVLPAADSGTPIELGGPPAPVPPTPGPVLPAPQVTPPGPEAEMRAATPPVPPAPDPAPVPATTPGPAPAPVPAQAAAPAPAPSVLTTAAGSWRDQACETSMLEWMNEARAASGRASAVDDPVIDHVAFRWSDHLAASGELAHNPTYSDEVFAARPEAMTAGEVVGRGLEARPIFDEFMRSVIHRDVIVGGSFARATVGCVRDAGGQLWVVANFWG